MKTKHLIYPFLFSTLIQLLAATPAFGMPVPHGHAKDHTTGVTLDVYGAPYAAPGANAEFLMIYITNPSGDRSVAPTTFVNIFGNSQTEYVPTDVVTIDSVSTSSYNATTPNSPETCTPPNGATPAGSFPTEGSCTGPVTAWQYRFAFHGWGAAAVAPGETSLVYFQGWTVGPNSHYDSDVSVTFSFEGATYTLTTTIHYSGF